MYLAERVAATSAVQAADSHTVTFRMPGGYTQTYPRVWVAELLLLALKKWFQYFEQAAQESRTKCTTG